MKKSDFNLLEILLAPQIVWSSTACHACDCTLPWIWASSTPSIGYISKILFVFVILFEMPFL